MTKLTALLMAAALTAAIAGAITSGPAPATSPTTQASRPAKEKLVFEDNFKDMANWVAEGPHTVEVKDGKLYVKTVQDDRNVGQYVWCRRELPDDFRVEFDVTPLSRSGFFLVFFCVQGVKGEDILGKDLFEGYMSWKSWKPYYDWDKYTSAANRKAHHQSRIRCYHASYRRNEQANCNLRKNPGLNLVKSSNIDALLPQDKPAHVVLTKAGPRITLVVNDKPFMDWTDPDAPYKGGRFGFRNVYDSEANYANFRMFDLGAQTPATGQTR
ncbi:MAG: DUF1961 family protein [Phycisphaerae bacterium]